MQAYDVKRGHAKALEGDGLRNILEEVFGGVTEVEGVLRVRQGALRELTAWFDGKALYVDTNLDREVDNATAAATIQAYNTFLQRATGFTAKQRRQRVQKKAKEGRL